MPVEVFRLFAPLLPEGEGSARQAEKLLPLELEPGVTTLIGAAAAEEAPTETPRSGGVFRG